MKIFNFFKVIALLVFFLPTSVLANQDLVYQEESFCGNLPRYSARVTVYCDREIRRWVPTKYSKEPIEIRRLRVTEQLCIDRENRINRGAPKYTCRVRFQESLKRLQNGIQRRQYSKRIEYDYKKIAILGYRNCKAIVTDIRGTSFDIYNGPKPRFSNRDRGKVIVTDGKTIDGRYVSKEHSVPIFDINQFRVKLVFPQNRGETAQVWGTLDSKSQNGVIFFAGASAFCEKGNRYDSQCRLPDFIVEGCSRK